MPRLSVRAYVNNTDLDPKTGLRSLMQAGGQTRVRTWLNTNRSAAEIYWLGHSVTDLISNGSPGEKVTMVVVGDGFGADEQNAYDTAVHNLFTHPTTGLFSQDFFARDRS